MELNKKELSEIINEIYLNYKFLEISEIDFKTKCLEIIAKSSLNNLDEINKLIINNLNKIIKDKLQHNPFDLITKFINFNLKDVTTYNNSLKELNKINLLFQNTNFLPSQELLIELINKNKKLSSILSIIIIQIKKSKISFNLDYYDDMTYSFLETYCMINEIAIEKQEDLESTLDTKDFLSDPVKMYFQEIGRYKILSREEERKIAYQILEGSKLAKEKLINHNLRLVVSISRRYVQRCENLTFLDLIQEGNLGLMTAVNKYDVTKGYRFSTYATWWIRQAILRAIGDKDRKIRIPINKLESLSKYKILKEKLEGTLNRTATIEEISKELNISLEKVIEFENLLIDTISLNTQIKKEEDSEFGDFIPSSEETPAVQNERKILSEDILIVINKVLKPKEADIIIKRFGLDGKDPMTLEEIGKIYNQTRERIRQIEARAIRKLRKDGKKLKGYVDSEIDIVDTLKPKQKVIQASTKIPTAVKLNKKNQSQKPIKSEAREIIDTKQIVKAKQATLSIQVLLKKISLYLNAIEYDILLSRYGINNRKIETLDEIGKRYNLKISELKEREETLFFKLKEEDFLNLTFYSDILLEKYLNFQNEKDAMQSSNLSTILEKISSYLDKVEYDILLSRYGLYEKPIETLEEISKRHNLDILEIRKIEENLFFKLKKEDFSNLGLYNDILLEKYIVLMKLTKENIKDSIENGEENMPKKSKTIFEIFSEYEKEEIIKVLENLEDKYKEIINLRYGLDLENPKRSTEYEKKHNAMFYNTILPKIRRELEKANKGSQEIREKPKKSRKTKTIFEIFSEYEKEDIIKVLESLEDKYREIINLRYGLDLDNPQKSQEYTHNHDAMFRRTIIPKIKKNLEEIKKSSISIEENVKPKEMTTKFEIVSFDERVKDDFNNTKEKDDYLKLLELLRPSLNFLNNLSEKERIIISLKFGIVENKYFDSETIANLFNISVYDINELITKILKDNLNKFLSKTKTILTNDIEITQETYLNILTILRNPLFIMLLKELEPFEIIIICMKLTHGKTRTFSNLEIAKFYDVKEEDVVLIIEKVMTMYQEKVNDLVDRIAIVDKQKVLK